MIFVDTNIFMYAVGKEHPYKQKCVNFLKKVARSSAANEYCINTEVLQEVLHRYKAINKPSIGFELFDMILNLQLVIHPIELGDLKIARTLMTKHPKIGTRDAVHLGFSIRREITRIISYDSDFDSEGSIERVEPS